MKKYRYTVLEGDLAQTANRAIGHNWLLLTRTPIFNNRIGFFAPVSPPNVLESKIPPGVLPVARAPFVVGNPNSRPNSAPAPPARVLSRFGAAGNPAFTGIEKPPAS